jgi:hypothetical protein
MDSKAAIATLEARGLCMVVNSVVLVSLPAIAGGNLCSPKAEKFVLSGGIVKVAPRLVLEPH